MKSIHDFKIFPPHSGFLQENDTILKELEETARAMVAPGKGNLLQTARLFQKFYQTKVLSRA
ncbi:hypothetical protein [Desulfobacula sp.]|uniref:hypothetical protein n=1 Tax=Desulfobacula sp. TaxID=2593537 RepID=UPI0025BCF3FD|nr:hypothetical protein [Desulfobacula sp.]MBC2705099.1 hypothetical protein [Desulfobacula sp.]